MLRVLRLACLPFTILISRDFQYPLFSRLYVQTSRELESLRSSMRKNPQDQSWPGPSCQRYAKRRYVTDPSHFLPEPFLLCIKASLVFLSFCGWFLHVHICRSFWHANQDGSSTGGIEGAHFPNRTGTIEVNQFISCSLVNIDCFDSQVIVKSASLEKTPASTPHLLRRTISQFI